MAEKEETKNRRAITTAARCGGRRDVARGEGARARKMEGRESGNDKGVTANWQWDANKREVTSR